MADNVLTYQCLTCGAPIAFDSETHMFKCEYCESTFSEEAYRSAQENIHVDEEQSDQPINWRTEGFVRETEVMDEQVGFNCPECGAVVIASNVVATECMYCKNPTIIQSNISGMVKPDYILPFKISKEEAENILMKFYEKKPLLPKLFNDRNLIAKVSGMYVPFWMFSCEGQGKIEFDARKIKTWSDRNYNYTETKYYSAYRAGTVQFEKIPVDSSKKMDDSYMDALEPFEYRDLKKFEPMYMAGFFAEKFDVNVDESEDRASRRVITSVENKLRSTVTGYSSVIKKSGDISMNSEKVDYAFLPVWMLNVKYRNKIHQFAINGQTGKVVGKLPIDKMKLLMFQLLYGGITLAVTTAIAYFGFVG